MEKMFFFKMIAAALATLFFALMRRTPARVLYIVAPLGAAGWAVFQLMKANVFAAYFTAALLIGVAAEIFARIKKTPSTVILICGIIPLVPGVMFYRTMMFFVQGETEAAFVAGVDTLLAAGILVFAVVVSTLLGRHIINPLSQRINSKQNKKRGAQ